MTDKITNNPGPERSLTAAALDAQVAALTRELAALKQRVQQLTELTPPEPIAEGAPHHAPPDQSHR